LSSAKFTSESLYQEKTEYQREEKPTHQVQTYQLEYHHINRVSQYQQNQQQHHHWMSLTEVFPARRNGLTFNNMFKTKHLEKTLE
jgi:hypothetical protein